MLNDCKYNKVKLLHELSSMAWFVEKCCIKDAQVAGDAGCIELMKMLQNDLNKYVKILEDTVKKSP